MSMLIWKKELVVLKVTPGHDFNDYEIGKRHNLSDYNILNKDGSFNETAKPIQGLKGKEARKATVKLLKRSQSTG
jgi:valyl-tRNA synthetase